MLIIIIRKTKNIYFNTFFIGKKKLNLEQLFILTNHKTLKQTGENRFTLTNKE